MFLRAHHETYQVPRSAWLFVLLIALLTFTHSCSTTQSAGDQVDDSELTALVEAKLAADPEVNPFDIDVDVADGVVRLTGIVADDSSRREAGRLAGETRGVVSVNNEITVGEESAGGQLDDAVIVARIKTKLAADPEAAAINIDVDSEQGVVTLSGMVMTHEARAEAEKLAIGTAGVKSVRNLITTEGTKDYPPPKKDPKKGSGYPDKGGSSDEDGR